MGSSAKQPSRPSVLWEARLRDFLHDCVSSAASEEEDRIREGARLLQRLEGQGHRRVDPVAIEAMLGCGAGESAVLELIGPHAPFLVSRGGSGTCLATLILPDGTEEVMAEGATLALSLLAGHAAYLLQQLEQVEEIVTMNGLEATERLH